MTEAESAWLLEWIRGEERGNQRNNGAIEAKEQEESNQQCQSGISFKEVR